MSFVTAQILVKGTTVYLNITEQDGFLIDYFKSKKGYSFRCSNCPEIDGNTVYLKGKNDKITRCYYEVSTRAKAITLAENIKEGLEELNEAFENKKITTYNP